MKPEFYREIMAHAPIAYACNELITDTNGKSTDYRFLEVNNAFVQLTGLKADNIIGKNAGTIFRKQPSTAFHQTGLYEKVVKEHAAETVEVNDENTGKCFSLHAYAIGNNCFVTIFNDITSEKQTRETLRKSEARFRGLIESQTDLIVRVDRLNRFTFVNEVYCKTFGKKPEELLGQSFFPLIHPDDREATGRAMEKLKKPPYRCRIEQRAMTVNGWRWLLWEDSVIFDENSQIAEIQGVGRDITGEKELTQTIIQSQKRLSLAQTFANIGSWEYNIESGKLIWSPECEALFGIPKGSFGGTFDDFLSMVHPDDKDFVIASNKPITELKEGLPLDYEHRIVNPDGRIRWVKEIAGVVNDSRGNPQQIVGFVLDVTQQKIAAEAIENQTNLQQITDNIDGVFWLRSADRTRMHYVSRGFEKIFGIHQQAIFDDPHAFMKVVHPDDREKVAKAYEQFMQSGSFEDEYRIIKPDGKIRWIVSNAFPVRNERNEIIRYAGIINDITERKQTEIAISEQAHKLNTLIEALPDMIFIMHRDGTILDIFGADPAKLIAPPQELLGKKIEDLFGKEESQRHLAIYNQCLKNKENSLIRFQLKTNNETLHFESRLRSMSSDTLLTIVRDITNEVNLNREKEHEAGLRQFLFENSKDGMVLLNDEHRVVDVNQRFADMLGYSVEEMKKLYTWDFEADHDEQDIRKNYSLAGQLDMTFESKHRRKDSSVYNAEISIKSFSWNDRRLVICSVRDITLRKEAEKNLRQSEQKYRDLIENQITGVIVHRPDTSILLYNEVARKLLGMRPDEISEKSAFDNDWHILNEQGRKLKPSEYPVVEVIKSSKPIHHRIYGIVNRKNKKVAWVQLTAYPEFHHKQLQQVVVSFMDISDLKRVEQKLRESKANLTAIIENTLESIWAIDTNYRILYVNDVFTGVFSKMYNVKLEVGQNILEVLPSELYNNWKPIYEKVFSGESLQFEDQVDDGNSKFYIEVAANPIVVDGKVMGASFFARNITEKKQADLALRRSEEKYRIVADNTYNWEFWEAPDGKFLYHSPACEQLTGHSPDELIENHRLFIKRIHPDDREAYQNHHKEAKLKRGKNKHYFRIIDPTGRTRYIEHLCLPVYDSEGHYLGVRGSNLDITDRHESENALRESELFANAIANNTPAMLYIYDLEKRKNIWVNELHRKTFEQLHFESTNMNYDDISTFMHPEDFLKLLEKTEKIAARGDKNSFDMECRLKWKDHWKWMHVFTTIFKRNNKGEGIQILGALFDIDDRKIAEEELRKFKTISDQANYGTAMAELNGNLIYVNDAFAAMHGLSVAECENKTLEIFHNKPQLKQVRSLNKELISKGKLSVQEVDHVKKDGTTFPTLMNLTLVQDKLGLPRFIAATAIDISEIKKTQLELLKLSQVVVQSPVSIFITDINGNIEYVNPRFTEISGFQPEEVIGKNPSFLSSGHHQPEEYKRLWETILAGKIWQGEMLNLKKNGEQMWENIIISPVKAENGTIKHFIAIKDDITEKKKMIADLVEAKEKAEESDKLKTSFINNINHEIRTPLNGILGFGQILTQQNLPAGEKEEYYKILQESTDRLIQTVTDYMDISMLNAGLIHLKNTHFSVIEMLDDLSYKFQKKCHHQGNELSVIKPHDFGDVMLDADKEHLQKALSHIIDNAVKFTYNGTIQLGCTLNEGNIKFTVHDTGKGIQPEKLKEMFNAFVQEDASNTRGYEGSGLGLAIAKGIIDLFDGKIHIESGVDKGTRVEVTIPFRGSVEQTTELPDMVGKKTDENEKVILIAEDIEENSFYLKVILEAEGYKTIHADNGLTAVEMCTDNPHIDLVLMDVKMPEMDGIEATRRIRKIRAGLPVIVVTAYAKTGDEHAIREAGANEILAKPINKEVLLKKIAKYINR